MSFASLNPCVSRLSGDPNLLQKAVEAARKDLAERCLSDLVRLDWKMIEPGIDYLPNWHIDAICASGSGRLRPDHAAGYLPGAASFRTGKVRLELGKGKEYPCPSIIITVS